ncbi:hypothetical protein HK097_008494 [Rhizophlyctis rosea]|uniref:Uncharacterized protein n=1 Tax=Rhizophlyctis rosea TaxID=64517 RepID=A0AAD5X7V1_9FUNG|nr:hypothetical protein HK097_008494 [Rhizophlyctis rosea]
MQRVPKKEHEGWYIKPRTCDRCLLAKEGKYSLCKRGLDVTAPCLACQTANKPCHTSTPCTVYTHSFEGRAVPSIPEAPSMTKGLTPLGLVFRKKRRVEAAAAGFDRTGMVPWCRPGDGRIVRASRYAPEQKKENAIKALNQFVDRWRDGADAKYLKRKRRTMREILWKEEDEEEDVGDSDGSQSSRSTKRSRVDRLESPDAMTIEERPEQRESVAPGARGNAESTATLEDVSPYDISRQEEWPSSDLLDAIHMYASKRFAEKGYNANLCMTGNSLVALGKVVINRIEMKIA